MEMLVEWRCQMRGERGQAAVEFVGTLPAVLLAAMLVWQLALAGHATWLCANAARVAARAELVGRDGTAAARSALPLGLERGLRVTHPGGRGQVRVRLFVPLLTHRWQSPLAVSSTTSLAPEL